MSTYYGVHCVTCNESSGHSFNRGCDVVQGMLAALHHIKAAIDTDTSRYIEIRFMGDNEGVLSFALDHSGHDLLIENEYGEMFTKTGESLGKRI